ncbi:hypothetical protein GYMLUDRAFT_767553 [Collybiopsis luxurians FD-317 M1]|uniref:Secreted protein n=1 Tax=Collybiopsis luxurians FD-317 M1 TaxID=944289 RepID=A0A0D0C4A9_9AGAR|nr:hypothetical protein GYMLUDRAFT_767553 [Collybiopsis luxurians FD-317 M1]
MGLTFTSCLAIFALAQRNCESTNNNPVAIISCKGLTYGNLGCTDHHENRIQNHGVGCIAPLSDDHRPRSMDPVDPKSRLGQERKEGAARKVTLLS